jgi:murein DD-endopeptidase MepM/ murein hydrolase activator NlpD
LEKEDGNIQNISGLSFRDLEQEPSTIDDPFILLDDDISGVRDLSWVRKLAKRIVDRFNPRKGFLAFLIDFAEYIVSRARVFWVLTSIIFEMIYKQFDAVKDNVVKRMFWGRGSFLKYISQTGVIIIAFILGISYVYRAPAITNANEGELDYISVAENDLMVMNATLNTLVPKDREKRGTEIYIVMNGDTLGGIASKFDVTVETVKWANSLSSDIVKPGQELEIPPTDGVLVTVKKGDTLASLTKKYEGNEQSVADFNWLDYPFTLVEGQSIFIPDGKMPEPPKPVYAATPKTYISGSYSVASSTGVADPNVGRFLSWPVAGGSARITQYYKGSLHRGIDIADSSLPSLVAAAGGTVIFAGCTGYCPPLGSTWGGSGYAWAVEIDHGNGYSTFYAHMKNIYVRTGQSVSRGQAIGQMGSTGRSTGPHVHFELRRGTSYGTQINPLPYTNW